MTDAAATLLALTRTALDADELRRLVEESDAIVDAFDAALPDSDAAARAFRGALDAPAPLREDEPSPQPASGDTFDADRIVTSGHVRAPRIRTAT